VLNIVNRLCKISFFGDRQTVKHVKIECCGLRVRDLLITRLAVWLCCSSAYSSSFGRCRSARLRALDWCWETGM